MIEETVTVIGIDGSDIIVRADTKSTCQSCSAQKGCGTSLLSQWLGRKQAHLHLTNTHDAKLGDELVIGLPERGMLTGSMIVYLLPIAMMFLMALIAEGVTSDDLSSNEFNVIIAGVSGLLIGGFVGRQLLKTQLGPDINPIILRKNDVRVKLRTN